MIQRSTELHIKKRPPIVAVLGHVDHGKTTLLDTIRKTHVTESEHGGITQHIGAYQIEVRDPKKKNTPHTLTFIDTPGHEAFSAMRSRGASVADVAILVVALDDSVKPQTQESIAVIQAAKIPFIVALNKADLPTARPDKVKQDLARYGVQLAAFGGEIPHVSLSAKTGKGVDELLDAIVDISTSVSLEADENGPLDAMIIETRKDKGKGLIATILVKNGTISLRDTLYDGEEPVVRVRAMFDEKNISIKKAPPGKPVEVLGFIRLPQIGSIVRDKPYAAEKAAEAQTQEEDELPDFLKPLSEIKKTLKIVLKTDTAGSYEAVVGSLHDTVEIIGGGVGDITEKDVQLAKSGGAFIVGFNVTCAGSVRKLAEYEHVVYRIYTLIYKLIEELHEVVEGMSEIITQERELGRARIRAEFPHENKRIAGVSVEGGRIARGDTVKIIRGEKEVFRTKISSLRTGKEEASKVSAGKECGILFEDEVDFLLEDDIIAFTKS